MPERPLIHLENVAKEYRADVTLIKAIRGISASIQKGEFIVILGKSDSGKSTLLSLIGGLIKATAGIVKIDGQNLFELSQDELAILRRSNVGIVFQHFHLLNTMTCLENVELPLLIANTAKAERRPSAIELLKKVGLRERLRNYPMELSGGEKQRTGIARSLINKPSLILADEPTGNLNSKTGNKIIDVLTEINSGMLHSNYNYYGYA